MWRWELSLGACEKVPQCSVASQEDDLVVSVII